jgi:hypothetical protein
MSRVFQKPPRVQPAERSLDEKAALAYDFALCWPNLAAIESTEAFTPGQRLSFCIGVDMLPEAAAAILVPFRCYENKE